MFKTTFKVLGANTVGIYIKLSGKNPFKKGAKYFIAKAQFTLAFLKGQDVPKPTIESPVLGLIAVVNNLVNAANKKEQYYSINLVPGGEVEEMAFSGETLAFTATFENGIPKGLKVLNCVSNYLNQQCQIAIEDNHRKEYTEPFKNPSALFYGTSVGSVIKAPVKKKAGKVGSKDQLDIYGNNSLHSDVADRPWSVFGKKICDDRDFKLTHISLFSGCGGFDLGFRQAGFKTIFANDINADACVTYRHNIGDIVEGDLRTVELPKLKRRPDILSAGFPCQPFSNAGTRKGVNDDRGTLFQTAINIVSELKPRAVVFENVRGLLSFKSDEKLLIEEICSQLDALGYDITFSLVDASRHHVAQKRLRVVIVGIERSKKHGVFSFPTPIDRSDLTLQHTILDLTPDAINQGELMQLNPQAIHIGSMVPEGGSWKDIPYDKLPLRLQKIWDNIERYRWPKFYRRFHRNEVAGTITAAFKPENAGVWHPLEKRIFSVREIGRIQSFPDWFQFEGKNIKSKYQQIGNAVPPRLAYELGRQIIEVLNGQNLRSERDYLTFQQFIKAGKPLRACDRDVIFSADETQVSISTKS